MREADHDPTAPTAARALDYAGPMARPAGNNFRGCGPAAAILAVIVLGIVVMLPRLGGSSKQAERVMCAANLRSVGQALQMYATAHGGRYPDTLEALYTSGDVPDPRVLTCPVGGVPFAPGATTQAVVANLAAGGHVSYVYIGAGLTVKAHGDTVLMYEHATNHKGDGGNVLFADGHVTWMQASEIRQLTALLAARTGPVLLAAMMSPATSPTSRPATQPAPGAGLDATPGR